MCSKYIIIVMLCSMSYAQLMKKVGMCPPPTNIGVCYMSCFEDNHCEGVQKCCRTACGGTYCVEPVTRRNVDVGEKPGVCPQKSGPWVCSSRCSQDSDCRGSKKCCENRCGAMACMKPAAEQVYMY